MKAININDKFNLFNVHWSPKIIASLNGQDVKIAKVKGEFVWHDHAQEDELFLIIKGTLHIEFRDKTVKLEAGELLVVPRGVEHKPVAEEEVWLMLIELQSTKHTGTVNHALTVHTAEHI